MRTPTPPGNYTDRKWNPVLTKADFVRRYAKGEFGNASPTWGSFVDWYADKPWRRYGNLYHIRNRVKGGETWYNVSAYELGKAWTLATTQYRSDQLYISAMAPTDKTLFQGEVQRSPLGVDLYYTMESLPMREALAKESRSASGIIGVSLLQIFLCPNSYDWLETLFERYPDHVIEFSAYSVEWGTLPGFNTVFWEVRKY